MRSEDESQDTRSRRVSTDGFNFCYAAFRRARFEQYKWLDRVALGAALDQASPVHEEVGAYQGPRRMTLVDW